jgi:hypothetical protein
MAVAGSFTFVAVISISMLFGHGPRMTTRIVKSEDAGTAAPDTLKVLGHLRLRCQSAVCHYATAGTISDAMTT